MVVRQLMQERDTEPVAGHKAPKSKFNVGNVQVAVWENEGKEGRPYSTVTLDKRYKAGEEWKSTKSLGVNELPKAILALQKAYEHLALREEE